jgi:hypothetical protein
MSNRLFIMGMFRSGTTLLGRMLHAHDAIVCASDPFRPFFNAFRDDVAREIDVSVDDFDPLEEYFVDREGIEVYEAVREASLDRSFPDEVREPLHERLLSRAEPFSPKITERLDAVQGETFREVYDDLWTYVPDAYGDGHEPWEATKEVWTTEFTPVLARAYPESKFVHVVRDPRAVCASKNVQKETKYPWLFLIRQWRKLAILSHLYDDRLADRVYVVRYEDLVRSPRDTAVGICEFLGIDLDERILDPSNFVDGAGDQWLQNTSYEESSTSFDTSSVDKWERTLTDRQVEFIEQLTYPEMFRYGYEPRTGRYGLADELMFDPPRVPTAELAEWITAYYSDWDRFDHVEAVGTERTRQHLLTTDEAQFEAMDEEVLTGFFLDPAYAATARRLVDR